MNAAAVDEPIRRDCNPQARQISGRVTLVEQKEQLFIG